MVNSSTCALIDFPNHSNVGDSAIWLGEINYLRERKCRIMYACDAESYSFNALRSLVGKNLILIHGGGNLGDLWPRHQRFRERVLKDFPDNRIVQLPQSIHFSNPASLKQSQEAFSSHPDFHLVVRDRPSYDFAKQNYSNPVYLCPDMAFMLELDSLQNGSKLTDVLILSRTDKEKLSSFHLDTNTAIKFQLTDWLSESKPRSQMLYEWAHKRLGWNSIIPKTILSLLALYAANSMAKERLKRGLNILGQGKAVVTDRLHALILSWLGNISVCYVDNSYRKLSNFVDTWLSDATNLYKHLSFEEAISSIGDKPKNHRESTVLEVKKMGPTASK